MPFVPHTDEDLRSMLAAIGAPDLESLFDEIPAELRRSMPEEVPAGLGEMEVTRLMGERARRDGGALCFIGAGAYDHHIPAAVWEVATRGEFYSAYTPYQAEASQGTLQVIYEFQSMMTALTAMDAANASLYDGASALAEAVLMAVRANRKSKSQRVLMPRTVHPAYRKVVDAICRNQGVVLEELPFDRARGTTDLQALEAYAGEDVTALVVPQPNFFGGLEAVDALTDWAAEHGALSIAVVNPVGLALLSPPGRWGRNGADIACGEGQPLGVPLSSGGPYFGFMCCRQAHIRQMPGRIVGRTVDLEGREGFTLTLQAREQHIRRSKATSNICTNQGLMVTAATIHMAILGPEGLRAAALASHDNARALVEQAEATGAARRVFDAPFFHEAVLGLNAPVAEVRQAMADRGILAGYDLSQDYPELDDCLLVCATEKRSAEDVAAYAEGLAEVSARLEAPVRAVEPRM